MYNGGGEKRRRRWQIELSFRFYCHHHTFTHIYNQFIDNSGTFQFPNLVFLNITKGSRPIGPLCLAKRKLEQLNLFPLLLIYIFYIIFILLTHLTQIISIDSFIIGS